MSEFKYGIYTAQDPNDHERQVLVDELEKMDDWEDNDAFKMLTWGFQQYLAIKILEVQPPCLIVRTKLESIIDLIRIKTVRAIEDATRRIEIKDFFRCNKYIRECNKYIREEEKKHEN